MKIRTLVILLVSISLIIISSKEVLAEQKVSCPKNSPFLCKEQIQEMISDAINPIQSSLKDLSTRVKNLENDVLGVKTSENVISHKQTTDESSIKSLNSLQASNGQRLKTLESATSSAGFQATEWDSHTSPLVTSSTSFGFSDVQKCPLGKMVVSGGSSATTLNAILDASAPEKIDGSSYFNAWRITYSNRPSDGTEYYVDLYALCVTASQ